MVQETHVLLTAANGRNQRPGWNGERQSERELTISERAGGTGLDTDVALQEALVTGEGLGGGAGRCERISRGATVADIGGGC